MNCTLFYNFIKNGYLPRSELDRDRGMKENITVKQNPSAIGRIFFIVLSPSSKQNGRKDDEANY